jgi:hypothetical protein
VIALLDHEHIQSLASYLSEFRKDSPAAYVAYERKITCWAEEELDRVAANTKEWIRSMRDEHERSKR